MDQEYQSRNPKTVALVRKALYKIYDRTFDEFDIKIILIGLREFISPLEKQVKSNSIFPYKDKLALKTLLDIADGVAHPHYRSEGVLKNFISSSDKILAKSWLNPKYRQRIIRVDNEKKQTVLALPSHLIRITPYQVFIQFIVVLGHFLGEKIKVEDFQDILEDLALCFYSILHLMQFPFLDNDQETKSIFSARGGYISIHSTEGKYRLWAGVEMSNYYDAKYGKYTYSDIHNRRTCYYEICEDEVDMYDGIEINCKNPFPVVAVRNKLGKLVLQKIETD